MRFSLAHTAKKMYPKKTIADLAHMTGLLRSQITDALDESCPVAVMDKEAIILSELWKYRDECNPVPINGGQKRSFHAIALSFLQGRHPPNTVMDSLIESGAVKKQGDSLLIISNSFSPNKNEESTLNLAGVVINRFIGTIIHNRNTHEGYEDKKFYQRSFKSTKVPPKNTDPMHRDLYAFLSESAMPKVRKIIERYEMDVPNSTYSECGASIFEFDESVHKKGEYNE